MKAESSNQIFGITQQLKCLGVRGLEIDLHYLQGVQAAPADPGALRVCHVSPEGSKKVREPALLVWEALFAATAMLLPIRALMFHAILPTCTTQTQIYEACSKYTWAVCKSLGIEDEGPKHTGIGQCVV
jgi:hypothetical protein